MVRSVPLLLLALAAAPAMAGDRLPSGAPYCAPPQVKPVFIAPMGEAFRAAAGQPYPSALWFAGADADHDGAVSRIEFLRDADRFFKTIDLDHDGRLVPEEIIAYERDVAPEIALWTRQRDFMEVPDAQRPRSGESGYGGAMGAGRYAWLNIPEPVASADTDVDRIVTRDEFIASAGRRFDALAGDAGRLSLKALPKTPLQMAIEGPCRPRPKPKKAGRESDRPGGRDPRGDRDDHDQPGEMPPL